MSGHTPGPWRVVADLIEVGPKKAFQPIGSCGCCNSPWMMVPGKDGDSVIAKAKGGAP